MASTLSLVIKRKDEMECFVFFKRIIFSIADDDANGAPRFTIKFSSDHDQCELERSCERWR